MTVAVKPPLYPIDFWWHRTLDADCQLAVPQTELPICNVAVGLTCPKLVSSIVRLVLPEVGPLGVLVSEITGELYENALWSVPTVTEMVVSNDLA